jgi:hypothetical protein
MGTFTPKKKPIIWKSEMTGHWYYSTRYGPVKGAKPGVIGASVKIDITEQMEEIINEIVKNVLNGKMPKTVNPDSATCKNCGSETEA